MQDDIVILTLSLPKGKNPRILFAVQNSTPLVKTLYPFGLFAFFASRPPNNSSSSALNSRTSLKSR